MIAACQRKRLRLKGNRASVASRFARILITPNGFHWRLKSFLEGTVQPSRVHTVSKSSIGLNSLLASPLSLLDSYRQKQV